MSVLRSAIAGRVHDLVGTGDGAIDLTRPPGDPGLFGPGSVAWRVHGDFTSMMAGGTAALLIQMLHPGALAGVWDHSSFREDLSGRLRRTAQFVAGTTYGSTATATTLIDRVRRVHDRIEGTLPDGTPYSANDSRLLTWVHAAEAQAFLAGYLAYRGPLTGAEQDRYIAETTCVAERLGAADIPRSRRELDAYFKAIRPALRYDERTRETASVLLDGQATAGAASAFGPLIRQAAIDLLPGWAAAMHGLSRNNVTSAATRIGARGMGRVLRWALRAG